MDEVDKPQRDIQIPVEGDLHDDAPLPNADELVEYRQFPDKEARDDIFLIGKRLAEHIHDNGITSLVLLDRSARPASVAFREYWKAVYPDEEMPKIYFVNPKGFLSREALSNPLILTALLEKAIMTNDSMEAPRALTQSEIEERFRKIYRELIRRGDKPIMLFDTCLHSGLNMAPVFIALQNIGFRDIRIGLANDRANFSGKRPDFVALRHVPHKSCYPFGRDKLVQKSFGPTSTPNRDQEEIEISREIRREIKQIMQKGIEEMKKRENDTDYHATLSDLLKRIRGDRR